MQAVKETTVWENSAQTNHIYLLDSDKMLAYIRKGTEEEFWFKNPIRIDKRGRKFELVEPNPFNDWRELLKAHIEVAEPVAWIKQVAGSKPGVFYTVNTDENTCTCPGYTFRGTCKHVKELEPA
jgi:hypothetical protein